MLAPLTVVLDSNSDLRSSHGLALIDDVSRFLKHQRQLLRGSFGNAAAGKHGAARARPGSRNGSARVIAGHRADGVGARQLQRRVEPGGGETPRWPPGSKRTGLLADPVLRRRDRDGARGESETGLGRPAGHSRAIALVDRPHPAPRWPPAPERGTRRRPSRRDGPRIDPRRRRGRAARRRAGQARHEVSSILDDPVGRIALNRLLITPETVREHPELLRSFAAYITPDGRRARIDLAQADRIYSVAGMDQVQTLRRRLNEFLGEVKGLRRDGPDHRRERRIRRYPGRIRATRFRAGMLCRLAFSWS